MRDRAQAVIALADDGVASTAEARRRTRAIAALETAPRVISISHYDAARDYQTGVQRARRPGPGAREDRIEAPAVLSAAAAKGLAEAALLRAEAGRVRRTIAAGLDAIGLAPGDCVSIAGEAGVWRIAKASVEAMVTILEVTPVAPVAATGGASSGRVLGAPDAAIGRTVLHVFEAPWLGDELLTTPRIGLAAAGEGAGWRRAALLYSLDDGASWVEAGPTADPAIMGAIEADLAAAPAALVDRANTIVVRLLRSDMMLGDADERALDRGANLALIGEELVQFGSALPLGGGRWRLGDLRRGRRGTEAMAGLAMAGDRFVLIEASAIAWIDVPTSAIGRDMRVLATGVGDGDAPVAAALTPSGVSVAPPSPAHLVATPTGEQGVALAWVRRSRLGWRWLDELDAPLAEEREAYLVSVIDRDGGEQRFATAEPRLTLAPPPPGGATISVRQQGTIALSPPTILIIGGTT